VLQKSTIVFNRILQNILQTYRGRGWCQRAQNAHTNQHKENSTAFTS